MEYPDRYLHRFKGLEVDCLRRARAIWMLKTDKCTGSVIYLRVTTFGCQRLLLDEALSERQQMSANEEQILLAMRFCLL